MKIAINVLLTLSLICSNLPSVFAQTGPTEMKIYVSINGSDSNDGTIENPFQTIKHAQMQVRKLNKNMKNDIAVYIREGTYFQKDTLTFSPEDSGTNGFNVKYIAYQGEKVTISGGTPVSGFRHVKNGIWQADVSGISSARELFVDGVKAQRARTNKDIHGIAYYDDPATSSTKTDGIIISTTELELLSTPEDVELIWAAGWKSYVLPAAGMIKLDNSRNAILMKQPHYSNAVGGDNAFYNPRFNYAFTVENALELLDEKGEFYFDKKRKVMYYMPRDGEVLAEAEVIVPVLETLVDIRGKSIDDKVKNIKFEGLTFAHATWNQASETGVYGIQGQWLIMEGSANFQPPYPSKSFVPANIQLDMAENITFYRNEFSGMGSVGLGMYNAINDISVQGNLFEDIANSAITVGLPVHVYENNEEEVNLALYKNTTASSYYSIGYTAGNAVDAEKNTGWASGASDRLPYIDIDLGDRYEIDRIELLSRQDLDQPVTRQNFEILASNHPEFLVCKTLSQCGSEPFPHASTWVAEVNDTRKFRYIRVQKTQAEAFFISELRVINNSGEVGSTLQVPRDILIDNNMINRAGYLYYMASGIQSYYTTRLKVSNNYLYDLPYIGIGGGWGWSRHTESKSCRENSYLNNRIENYMNKCFDGGGIYTLGQQPKTIIEGNYLINPLFNPGGIYTDQGSAGMTVKNNVIDGADYPLFVHSADILDIMYDNNYYTSKNILNRGTNVNMINNKLYLPEVPPDEVVDIIANAGLDTKYQDLILKTTIKPANRERTIDNYATMHETWYQTESKYKEYTVDAVLKAAETMLELLSNDAFSLTNYDDKSKRELEKVVSDIGEKAKKNSFKTRDEITNATMQLYKKMDDLHASNTAWDIVSLREKANEIIEKAVIGNGDLEFSPEKLESLKQALEKENIDEIFEKARAFVASQNQLAIDQLSIDEVIAFVDIDRTAKKIKATVPFDVNCSDLKIKIYQSSGAAVNPEPENIRDFSSPVQFNISNGSNNELWTIDIKNEEILNTDKVVDIDPIIADSKKWVSSDLSGLIFSDSEIKFSPGISYGTYMGKRMGDVTLQFKMKLIEGKGEYPMLQLRVQNPKASFNAKGNAMYIVIFKQNQIEVMRFVDGKRTMFYGDGVADSPPIFGVIQNNFTTFGQFDDVEVGTENIATGVRLHLTINGQIVFDIVDVLPDRISKPGYLGFRPVNQPIEIKSIN